MPAGKRYQVGVLLEEYWHRALRAAADRDRVTAPELVRQVVLRHLAGRLKRDPDLRDAVDALLRSRDRSRPKSAPVYNLSTKRPTRSGSATRRDRKATPDHRR